MKFWQSLQFTATEDLPELARSNRARYAVLWRLSRRPHRVPGAVADPRIPIRPDGRVLWEC